METFNSLGNKMLGMIEDRRHLDLSGAAKRDLALSATHLEDALTRYNSACYRVIGNWQRADPEADREVFPGVPPAWRGEDGGWRGGSRSSSNITLDPGVKPPAKPV